MLFSLAIIFLSGLFAGQIFQKIKLPSLIGMLIMGIILGSYALSILDSTILSISADLRQIALIIILSRAGLSLDLDDLKKIGRPAVLMSFVPAFFEMAGTIFFSMWLLDLPLLDAAILAAVVASASPAVNVPRMIKLIDTGYGTNKSIPQLILAGDSVDDVLNIVIFTALISLAGGEKISAARFMQIPISITIGIIIGVLIGLLTVIIFSSIHIRDSSKVIFMLSLALLLLAFEDYIENKFPFSSLLSIMTMGVIILRKSPVVAKRISIKFSKLWVGAEIILFVLVGASVNIHYAASAGFKTIFLLVAVLFIRAMGILLCLLRTNLNRKERLFCTFTGIPKATVQAAIGGIPLALGLSNSEIILAVAVLAILFTAPLGAFIIDNTYERLLFKNDNSPEKNSI